MTARPPIWRAAMAEHRVAGRACDQRPRPGDPETARQGASQPRAGWAWTRIMRRYDEYERARAELRRRREREHGPPPVRPLAHLRRDRRASRPVSRERQPVEEERRTSPSSCSGTWCSCSRDAGDGAAARQPTWAGFGRSMLVLASSGGRGRRSCGRPTRVDGFNDAARVAARGDDVHLRDGLALPQAFGSEATLFAGRLRGRALDPPRRCTSTRRARATRRGRDRRLRGDGRDRDGRC